MKFLKRNQVIVLVIGLMLVTAGYLNFNNNKKESQADILQSTGALADSEQLAEIGDAQLVSTKPANDSDLTSQEEMKNEVTNTQSKQEIQEVQANNEEVQKENKEESTETNANSTINDEYFTKSRLERDTMYSQMLESYQKILDKNNISEGQKTTAQNEIKKINELKNAIMIT